VVLVEGGAVVVVDGGEVVVVVDGGAVVVVVTGAATAGCRLTVHASPSATCGRVTDTAPPATVTVEVETACGAGTAWPGVSGMRLTMAVAVPAHGTFTVTGMLTAGGAAALNRGQSGFTTGTHVAARPTRSRTVPVPSIAPTAFSVSSDGAVEMRCPVNCP
jgi:hypothetical protein